MGLRGPKPKIEITRELVDSILNFMGDGSVPFLAVAAERAGVNRNRAKDWIANAERGLTANPLMIEFAMKARKIRAEWVAKTSRDLQENGTKEQYQSSRHKAWLLERVDRELFDSGVRFRPDPDQDSPPPPQEPTELKQTLEDLEKPDHVHVQH